MQLRPNPIRHPCPAFRKAITQGAGEHGLMRTGNHGNREISTDENRETQTHDSRES